MPRFLIKYEKNCPWICKSMLLLSSLSYLCENHWLLVSNFHSLLCVFVPANYLLKSYFTASVMGLQFHNTDHKHCSITLSLILFYTNHWSLYLITSYCISSHWYYFPVQKAALTTFYWHRFVTFHSFKILSIILYLLFLQTFPSILGQVLSLFILFITLLLIISPILYIILDTYSSSAPVSLLSCCSYFLHLAWQ